MKLQKKGRDHIKILREDTGELWRRGHAGGEKFGLKGPCEQGRSRVNIGGASCRSKTGG